MTLMEVIISILLVAMVLAGVATAVTWSLSTIRAARESSAALQAVQQEMERMRNSNFSTILDHAFAVPALGAGVNGSVAVQSENIVMKRVSAQVSWVSNGRRDMSVSLVSYITKDGIDQR
jgi:type II secretory pathway pseudopilin PulG